MLRPSIHRATAAVLTLLYLMVGLTGESAHYGLERLSAASTSDEEAAEHGHSHGYYHCHGPDYHWHYHSHRSDEPPAAESERVRDKPAGINRVSGTISVRAEHHSHACPLLSMVSALKLGFAPSLAPMPWDRPCQTLRPTSVERHIAWVAHWHLARGPPLYCCVA